MTFLTRLAYWWLHRRTLEDLPLDIRADILFHFSDLVADGMNNYREQITVRSVMHPELSDFYQQSLARHVPFILEQSVIGIMDRTIDTFSRDSVDGAVIGRILRDMQRDGIRKATWRIADAQRREHAPSQRSENRIPPAEDGEGKDPSPEMGDAP